MSVTTTAPRKWLGPRGGLIIVAAGVVLWFTQTLVAMAIDPRAGLPIDSLIIGAFTVASAFVYTMAYRLKPTDRLSVVRLLLAFLLGGLLSTAVAAPIDWITNALGGGFPDQLSLLSLSLAGVIEELVKIGVVVLMSIGLARRNVRNGLFLGGAVGFGFAALEDMTYAANTWDTALRSFQAPLGPELFNVITRDLVGIFGHPLFTALLSAAVFAAVRNNRFRWSWIIPLVYIGVAFAHGLFDAGGDLVYKLTFDPNLQQATYWSIAVLEAVVLSLIWRQVSHRANAAADLSIRRATAVDLEFLTWTLVATANWDRDRGVTFESVHQNPALWHYLEGWPRISDFGLIALDNDRPVGAIWARTLDAKDAGYGFVDDATPELTLGIVPVARGRKIGRMLLSGLIGEAKHRGLSGVSLSVEDGNAVARKLYTKSGFTVVGRTGNSDTMLLRF